MPPPESAAIQESRQSRIVVKERTCEQKSQHIESQCPRASEFQRSSKVRSVDVHGTPPNDSYTSNCSCTKQTVLHVFVRGCCFNSLCYHALIKPDWRISVKDYSRCRNPRLLRVRGRDWTKPLRAIYAFSNETNHSFALGCL